MSVYHPPVNPVRVESTLLPLLREAYPDVTVGSLRNVGNPSRECVIVGEPQGMATAISQYVRLRVSVIVRRDDHTGDLPASQRLAGDIIHTLTSQGCVDPIISCELSSGPMRMTDSNLIFSYAILLLQVAVNK
jgi:hypothetical protein